MKILVTGGAGFMGRWLLEKFPTDAEIIVLDLSDEQVHRKHKDFAPEVKARAQCLQADVENIDAYQNELGGTDIVIYLASQTGTGQSMYEISRYVQHNVNGTAKLLELISKLEHKPHRIILSSRRAVYGAGAYADGKEIYCPKGRRLEDLQQGIWEGCDNSGEPLQFLPMQESQLTQPTSVYGLTKLRRKAWVGSRFYN